MRRLREWRGRVRWWQALLLSVWVLLATPGFAQTTTPAPGPVAAPADAAAAMPVDEKRRTEAKERFLRGLDLASQDSWDAALVEFMASRELFPTRAALSNIPLSLRHLNRYAEAIDAYNELVQKFGTALSPEERKKVDEALGELRSFVGEIDVESEPRGAGVIVDGQQRGVTPLPSPIVVNAGTHSVRVSSEGFESFEAQVPVAGKQRKTVQAKLRRLAKSGNLLVKEAGGQTLDVVIDGAVVGKTPWQGVLSVGVHAVMLRGEGDLGSLPGAATVKENETSSVTLVATKLDAKVRVEPVPATSRVDIDGVAVGAGIWEGQLTSGSHTIEVYAPGHLPYRKPINVSSGRREIVRVALERDLNDPMWSAAFRPHLFVELTGGLGFAPSFGTSAEAACNSDVALDSGTVSGCADRSRPFGFIVGGRGGYQISSGLALEVFMGYLQLSNSLKRAVLAEGERQRTYGSSDFSDKTSLSAPLAALSASYHFFDKTPLTLRIWAGAMRAHVKHEVGGTFAGDVAYADAMNEQQTARLEQRVAPFEPATNVWVPLLGPEVRFGYRIGKRFQIDVGVAGLLFFGPGQTRQGGSAGDPARRPSPLEDFDAPDGTRVKPGVLKLPQESSVSTFFGVLPTLGARLDF
jgi:hypothetical protein